MRLTDHKTVGVQYAFTALAFLLIGFVLMLVMRWQLAWPTSALPPALAMAVGDTNAPGGYMAPEFYNQLVAMHGTVMIFLAVVPLLTGALGNYVVPLQIGASDMAFPQRMERVRAVRLYWSFVTLVWFVFLAGFYF